VLFGPETILVDRQIGNINIIIIFIAVFFLGDDKEGGRQRKGEWDDLSLSLS